MAVGIAWCDALLCTIPHQALSGCFSVSQREIVGVQPTKKNSARRIASRTALPTGEAKGTPRRAALSSPPLCKGRCRRTPTEGLFLYGTTPQACTTPAPLAQGSLNPSRFRPSFFDMRFPRSRFLPPEMGRLGISRAPPPSVPQIFPAATARMRRLFCPVFPTMQIHKKERKCIS